MSRGLGVQQRWALQAASASLLGWITVEHDGQVRPARWDGSDWTEVDEAVGLENDRDGWDVKFFPGGWTRADPAFWGSWTPTTSVRRAVGRLTETGWTEQRVEHNYAGLWLGLGFRLRQGLALPSIEDRLSSASRDVLSDVLHRVAASPRGWAARRPVISHELLPGRVSLGDDFGYNIPHMAILARWASAQIRTSEKSPAGGGS